MACDPILKKMTRFMPLLLAVACTEYKFVERTDETPGGEPRIMVDPDVLDMGTYGMGGPIGTRIVTVSNVGEAPLNVYDATIATPTGPFSVTAISDITLEKDAELDLIVEFTPSEWGTLRDQLVVTSNDPERPETAVELTANVPEPTDDRDPDAWMDPLDHDFGVLTVSDESSVEFTLGNDGEGALQVNEVRFISSTGEMTLDAHPELNGALPWTLEPGENRRISARYQPTDDGLDVAQIVVLSNDPDEPEIEATLTGGGRSFSGFSTGWYIYDDGIDHETTSSPSYVIDSHGDLDLYWYEPSGAHGLVDSPDPEADFAVMRDYVIAGAGAPTEVTGPISFSSSSHLATYHFATFTYVACDFWIEPDEDPVIYTVGADAVDDGVQFMVNGEILGHMYLHSPPTHWSLHEVGRPGEVNTLIAILVDDSASHRYLNNLKFSRDGVMIE
jgi:hypothetical protein